MLFEDTRSAFEKGAPLKGALGDAAAGATIGSVIPGIGTAIGAGIGAAIGLASGALGEATGEAGNLGAREYYRKTLFPEIEADRNGQTGDFQTMIADVNRTAENGRIYMAQHWGQSAANWVQQNYLAKEVQLAISTISDHAKGGSQYVQMQGAQFHGGGYVGDFGDLGLGNGEGFAKLLLGESVNTRQATSAHAPYIGAMNSGASPSEMAAMYLANSRSSGTASAAASGGDTHFHIHTLDTKTMDGWLRNGGARQITKHQNNLNSQYAGDGVIG
jgi:hypothetical protein